MNLSRKLRISLLPWAGILVVFIGLQFVVNRDLARGTPPAIRGPGLDGQAYAGLATLGKPGIIYFWASWCGICRAMQGAVQDLAREKPMISIAMQSGGAAEVKGYMAKQGFDIPVVVDEEGTIARAYGIRGVPAIFILGPDGQIRFSTIGYTSEIGLRARLWLAGW